MLTASAKHPNRNGQAILHTPDTPLDSVLNIAIHPFQSSVNFQSRVAIFFSSTSPQNPTEQLI